MGMCETQESFGKVPVAVHFYKNHALPRRSYEAFFQIGETFQFQWVVIDITSSFGGWTTSDTALAFGTGSGCPDERGRSWGRLRVADVEWSMAIR